MMNRKGFTLIELMIVIAIIGILAAMAMPNFKTSRWQARQKACYSNIRVVQGAVEMYNMDTPDMISNLSDGGAALVTAGYLKQAPKCPELNESCYTGTDLAGNGEVYCKVAGVGDTISKMDRTGHGSLSGGSN